MRVLITGGTGLLGKALFEGAPKGWQVLTTSHRILPPAEWRDCCHLLDLQDEAAVLRLIETLRPEVVIHTASIGGVDEAERDPVSVRAINVIGTATVGRACARVGAGFVFISSNAVFDGRHPPYDEQAPTCAVNRYGALKIEAEAWVRASTLPWIIIRPILMYGWPLPGGRGNVVTRWLALLKTGRPIEVAQELYSMPLLVDNCAEAVWAAIQQRRTGLYHVAGADRVSLVDFARAVARAFGYEERRVVPVPSTRFATLALRPVDTSFVTMKMEQELGVRPIGIAEGLATMQRVQVVVGP